MNRMQQAAEEIVADLKVNRYLSVEDVARHYGISRQGLYKELQRMGVTNKFCALRAKSELGDLESHADVIIKTYCAGASIEDIAAMVDFRPYRVRQWLSTNGYTRRHNGHGVVKIFKNGVEI